MNLIHPRNPRMISNPGRLMRSTLTAADGTTLGWTRNASDHATPFDQRWAGWYVTGKLSGLPPGEYVRDER